MQRIVHLLDNTSLAASRPALWQMRPRLLLISITGNLFFAFLIYISYVNTLSLKNVINLNVIFFYTSCSQFSWLHTGSGTFRKMFAHKGGG